MTPSNLSALPLPEAFLVTNRQSGKTDRMQADDLILLQEWYAEVTDAVRDALENLGRPFESEMVKVVPILNKDFSFFEKVWQKSG